jgi:hypothetical protein
LRSEQRQRCSSRAAAPALRLSAGAGAACGGGERDDATPRAPGRRVLGSRRGGERGG